MKDSNSEKQCGEILCCQRPLPCWSCNSQPFRLIIRRVKKSLHLMTFSAVIGKLRLALSKRSNPSVNDRRCLNKFISWCLYNYPVSSELYNVQDLKFGS